MYVMIISIDQRVRIDVHCSACFPSMKAFSSLYYEGVKQCTPPLLPLFNTKAKKNLHPSHFFPFVEGKICKIVKNFTEPLLTWFPPVYNQI